MDDESKIKQSWWRKKWAWLLFLTVFCAVGLLAIVSKVRDTYVNAETQIAFDPVKWNLRNDTGYLYRNDMLQDLIDSKKLKRLRKDEIIGLLGEPTRTDSAYLFYRITQHHIGFVPFATKTLVIKVSGDTTANKVMIHQ